MSNSLTEYGVQTGALAPPPAQPAPFDWSITSGSDTWTDDADMIAKMSDPAIVQGLIREAEVIQIVGAAKTSKTWFTLFLSLTVAAGDYFLGRETEARKVLYLDYELKPGTFRKRMSMLAAERPERFHYQCLRGAQRLPSMTEIAEIVTKEGFGMVVIDSLYRTGWLTEENSNDSTSRELAPLQRLADVTRAAIICVDHTAKGGGNGKSAVDASRGSSTKGGFFDSVLVLRVPLNPPEEKGNYVALDSSLRDWPGINGMPLISFTWTASTASIDIAGEIPREDINKNGSKILQVLAGVSPASMTRAEIQKACGDMKQSTCERALKELVDKSLIAKSAGPSGGLALIYRVIDMADGIDDDVKLPKPHQTSPA